MTVELELNRSKIDTTFPEKDIRVRVGYTTEYAAAVNYGTDPHWPPLTPMVKWTNRMGWENYNLSESDKEGRLWEKVDQRRAEGEPLPAAYLLARHIAENGTKPMQYASDAFIEAQQQGEKWLEGRDYDADTRSSRSPRTSPTGPSRWRTITCWTGCPRRPPVNSSSQRFPPR